MKDGQITVLVVDDEAIIRESIGAYLEDSEYKVRKASSGQMALEMTAEALPDIVLLDLSMPAMSGIEVLERLVSQYVALPVLIVSGLGSLEDAIGAIKKGAWDYVTKPIQNMEVLEHAIARAIEKRNLRRENLRYREHLEQEVEQRTRDLRDRTVELEETQSRLLAENEERRNTEMELQKALTGTVKALALVEEERDPYTVGHQRRVARLAVAISKGMGMEPEQVQAIRMAGLIHDIGKVSIPAEILNKPGRLSEPEFRLIRGHAETGYQILKTIEFPWPLADIVRQHHERLDGSGYPLGLMKADICIEAQVLAVADVVEAMSSDRPYRAALGIQPALEEIDANRENHFENKIVDACLRLFREEEFCFDKTSEM